MPLPTYQSLASEEELDDQVLGALPTSSAGASPLNKPTTSSSLETGALPGSAANIVQTGALSSIASGNDSVAGGNQTAASNYIFGLGVLNNPFVNEPNFIDMLNTLTASGQSNLWPEYWRQSPGYDLSKPLDQFAKNVLSHKTTDIQGFKDDKGNQFIYIAGKPTDPTMAQDRGRMSQVYLVQGDKLVPVGEQKTYKGENVDAGTVEAAGMFASMLAGPVLGPEIAAATGLSLPASVALANTGVTFAKNIAAGADPIEALKNSAKSYGISTVSTMLGTMLPADLQSVGTSAINQLLTTGKVNVADLATAYGISLAADTLAAEANITKADAQKLINAGLAVSQGNVTGALTNLAQVGLKDALGVDTLSGSGAIDEYNVTGGGGALISSGNPAEDEQIALQQRILSANQAISDYAGSGNDLSREGLISQLQSLGLTADQAEGYAQKADQQINMNRVGADVMNRYSKIDPEFGTSQLDRDTAVQEMVAAGFTSERANEILNGIDAQNAIKLDNRLSVQSAYQNFVQGKGTEDQLRSALTSAGYTDAEINGLITRGRGVLEGSKLTVGEQAQERASQLPDIRGEIASKSNFNDAYALAREKLGAGATFTWQGKSYSTATAEERPDLTGKAVDKTAPENQKSLDLTGATEWDLNLMRTPLGFDANNATTARLMSPQEFKSLMSDPKLGIDQSTINQRYQAYLYSQAPRVNAGQRASLPFELAYRPPSDVYENPPTSFDEFKNTVLGGVSAGSKVASDAQNVVNSLTSKIAALAPNIIAGVTSSVTGDSQNSVSTLMRQIGDLASSAGDVVVPQLALGVENIGNAVNAADGLKNKVGALVNGVIENPAAAMWWISTEGSEELLPIGIAAKVLKATGSVRAAALADGLTNFLETAGLTQEELTKKFQDLGLTSTQAAQAASPGAFAAGAAESIISPFVDLPAIKLLAKEGADAGQSLGKRILSVVGSDIKETAGEALQEGSGSLAKQLATTGKIDTNEALTDAILGGFVGGKTSAGMTTLDALSQPGVLSGAVQESIDKLGNNGISAITASTLKAGGDSSSAGQILLAAQSKGVDVNEAVLNIVQGASTAGIDLPGVFANLSTTLQSTGLTEADASKVVVDAASKISNDLGSAALTATKKPIGNQDVVDAGGVIPAGGQTFGGTGPAGQTPGGIVPTDGMSALALQNLLASSQQIPGGSTLGGPAIGSQVPGGQIVAGPSGGPLTVPTQGQPTGGQTLGGGQPVVNTGPSSQLTGGKTQEQIAAEARLAEQADRESRTYKGLTYPTVDAASAARLADSAPGAQQATRSDLESTLKSMGLTPTKEAMDSLLSGNPTNDQLLTRLRSAPDLLASLKPATVTTETLPTSVSTAGTPTIVTSDNSTVETDPETGIVKQQVVDPKTNVTTTITTDPNTQSTTEVRTDGGVTTTITTDPTLTTQSTVDTNTGRKTDIWLDSNTNTTTQVIDDPASNTKVTVTWRADGGTTAVFTDADGKESVFENLDEIGDPPTIQTTAESAKTAAKKETKPKTPAPKPSATKPAAKAPSLLIPSERSVDDLGVLTSSGDVKLKNPLEALIDRVEQMNQIDPSLAAVMSQRLGIQQTPTYTYGQETSIDDILGLRQPKKPEMEEPLYAEGGYVEPLRAMNPQFMYRSGGALPGGREDFKGGKHVAGDGDGQSDDIPAWLADGEFVFPADVVSALGNGSTKAGTDKLYKMMHEIRSRARSTKEKDLPPPAHKSPLDYLKKGK